MYIGTARSLSVILSAAKGILMRTYWSLYVHKGASCKDKNTDWQGLSHSSGQKLNRPGRSFSCKRPSQLLAHAVSVLLPRILTEGLGSDACSSLAKMPSD